ncbi:hypothetical protein RN001_007763 [Aquatica leii]|uniref:(S)-2-hydroxy-acid oxidase n=1 Tax=Aquatica leii TaxID=1421715 RepID=A0AAN7SFP7_9COLE|nr:hypothetical protein RN001_007763 [Aquatica leii]
MNDIVCVQDLENHAYKVLPKNILDYYKSGALSEQTLKLNRSAFSNFRIRPRMMRNVTDRDLSITVMGEKVAMPIGIAPTAMQKMAHPEGEAATAMAAQEKGVIYILSTIATTSIEEIATVAPNAIKWFQLYVYKDRGITKQLIQRAEKAGFKALVLTVDAPVFGLRLSDVRNKFTLPSHLKFANFEGTVNVEINEDVTGSGINKYVSNAFDTSLTWDDLKWLRSITKLPILLKGILTAEDAIKAADLGVVGIIVSNHGARQVDSVPASIEVLPEIVKAVGDRMEVFIDGGFREGIDVFKALALGAKMVFVGRPVLWGLSYDGQRGVKKVFDMLENEFDNTMTLTGCATVKDIIPDMVVHKSYYSRM